MQRRPKAIRLAWLTGSHPSLCEAVCEADAGGTYVDDHSHRERVQTPRAAADKRQKDDVCPPSAFVMQSFVGSVRQHSALSAHSVLCSDASAESVSRPPARMVIKRAIDHHHAACICLQLGSEMLQPAESARFRAGEEDHTTVHE
ncbi:hypothetical protein CGRA01v4_07622 [Colletotrichum graminicola]|nr:hypothetical protein CGRA01v4_07622 [Colletotrichum graminicola]